MLVFKTDMVVFFCLRLNEGGEMQNEEPHASGFGFGLGAWGSFKGEYFIFLGSVLTDYLVCSATAAAANSLCLFFQS